MRFTDLFGTVNYSSEPLYRVPMSFLLNVILAGVLFAALAGSFAIKGAIVSLFTPSDLGREYVEVSKALTDVKLPQEARRSLELRKAVVGAQIRNDYANRIDFDATELSSSQSSSTSVTKDAAYVQIGVTNVTPGVFSDYDWSVGALKSIAVEETLENSAKGIVKFERLPEAYARTNEQGAVLDPRLTATLKADHRISASYSFVHKISRPLKADGHSSPPTTPGTPK